MDTQQIDMDFCPYVGLAPFDENHADYYFGRDLDANNLADNVLVAPVTVLYGPSGVGKTSLLNVGLGRALESLCYSATLVLFRRWQGGQFRSVLYRRIARSAFIAAAELHEAREGLARFVPWVAERTKKPVVLVLDQFEEYFIYQDNARALRFEEELDELVRNGHGQAHILIAIRDDRYHLLERLRPVVSGILDNTMELAHLGDQAVGEAIAKPVHVYNQRYRRDDPIWIEPSFVNRLIRELKEVETGVGKGRLGASRERRIELPYLQLALEKIWQAAGGARATSLDEARLKESSVRQIVADHVDGVLNELNFRGRALCASIFDRVVTPSGAKIAMSAADLAGFARRGGDVAHVERVLDRLCASHARVFTPVPRPDGEPAYQIFHDVLAQPVLKWKERYEWRKKIQRYLATVSMFAALAMVPVVQYNRALDAERRAAEARLQNAFVVNAFRANLARSVLKHGSGRPLFEALKSPRAEVREAAVQLLAALGPEVTPELIDLLKEPDFEVRRSAAEALGRSGPGARDAVPALTELLKDPNAEVRRSAAAALGAIGPGAQAAVPALTERRRDPDGAVREAAAQALVRIHAADK